MTIRRGEDWGAPGPLAPGAPVAHTDTELAAHIERTRIEGGSTPEVGLLGGDLHRTLGAPTRTEDDLRAGAGLRLPCDAIEVELVAPDGTRATRWAVAHVVLARAKRGGGPAWWRDRTVVVMNATHIGDLDLGPRAHPGDGLLDVTDGALPARDRRRARARAVTGTHVPHPALAERRVRELEVEGLQDSRAWLDGIPVGSVAAATFRVLPDALLVVV
ncbi:MAG: hypothetical protein ACOYOP_10935 [Microthrixaceae bacterium]